MIVAQWMVNLAMAYAALGVAFAVAFVFYGVGKIDPAAKDAPLTFRLLIFPGVAALWPLLLKRWLNGQTLPPVEQNAHRNSANSVKEAKS
ncbi:MAG: hypothetical protein SF097_03860 [Acidobacteriota bacterium]|nr:hypothetical protein [Acidobacteriota bacterium]